MLTILFPTTLKLHSAIRCNIFNISPLVANIMRTLFGIFTGLLCTVLQKNAVISFLDWYIATVSLKRQTSLDVFCGGMCIPFAGTLQVA